MISITDLMIMSPGEIKKASKKLSYKEIDDLVSELDNEASNMIKQNGKNKYWYPGLATTDVFDSEFYDPKYVYNWTSTINQLIEIRKILARSQIKNMKGMF